MEAAAHQVKGIAQDSIWGSILACFSPHICLMVIFILGVDTLQAQTSGSGPSVRTAHARHEGCVGAAFHTPAVRWHSKSSGCVCTPLTRA